MYPRPLPPKKKRRTVTKKRMLLSISLVLITITYCGMALARPFNELQPAVASDTLRITTPASSLPWPSYGQAAYGLADGKVIAQRGEQVPVPIASVSKLITSLVVLDRKPITDGKGPTITMTQADADLYTHYVAIRGSVTPISAGQELTQYDMLEAILLPSANNVSDSLAIWAFGSMEKYHLAANSYLQKHGLKNTRVGGDASGYLSDSVSTTSDLVKLGSLVMKNPVLTDIVRKPTAVIPGVGTVRNVNNLLGDNGIVGIKTGNNDDNTGVFLGATTANVEGKDVIIISALSGAPTLGTVLRDSNTFLAAARTTFADTAIVQKGAVLGRYAEDDGDPIQAVAADSLNAFVLRGDTVSAKVTLKPISVSAKAGDVVGTVTLPDSDANKARSVNIVLKQAPIKPNLWYRLTHLIST